MEHFEAMWDVFRTTMLEGMDDKVVLKVMREVFFAGGAAACKLFEALAILPTEMAEVELERLFSEMKAFEQKMIAGEDELTTSTDH